MDHAENIKVAEVAKHRRTVPNQVAYLEVESGKIGRVVVPASDFDKSYFQYLPVLFDEALFRLLSNVSSLELIVKINRITGQIFFLKDYEEEDSGWKRGKKFKNLYISDTEEFAAQFTSRKL